MHPPHNARHDLAALASAPGTGMGRVEWVIVGWLLLAVWFCSWTWGPTREWWNQLDLSLFQTTNAWLQESALYRRVLVAMNSRMFDVLAACATACLLVYARPRSLSWRTAMVSFTLLAVAVVVAKFAIVDGILIRWCDYGRVSPTLAVDCVRASSLEHWVESKDSSRYCFPSDHGMVVFVVAMYVLGQAPRKWPLVIAYVFCFTAPRVLIGAHWLTDLAMGSLLVACAGVLLHCSLLPLVTRKQNGVAVLSPAEEAGDQQFDRQAA